MTKAKQFLIKQHKTGRYDAITSNPNPDYNAPFFNSIAVLLEEYGKQARIDENNGWVRKCNEAKGHGLEADQFTIEDFEKRNKELK